MILKTPIPPTRVKAMAVRVVMMNELMNICKEVCEEKRSRVYCKRFPSVKEGKHVQRGAIQSIDQSIEWCRLG